MPLLIFVLFIGFGTVLFIDYLMGNSPEEFSFLGLFFMYSMGFSFLFLQFKNLKTIHLENKGVFISGLFSKQFHPWKNIQFINLTSSESFLLQQTPAISIKLKTGKKEVIFEFFYRNMPEFKRFLNEINLQRKKSQQVNLNKINPKKLEKVAIPDDLKNLKTYSGQLLLSILGIGFCIISAMIVYFFIYKNVNNLSHIMDWIFPIFFWLLIAIYFGHQFHYFQMSSHFLIIRNQLFFWKKKAFRLSEIREITFEEPYRRAKGIRITTEDFESTLFLGASLSDKTWNKMRTELTKKKIKVI